MKKASGNRIGFRNLKLFYDTVHEIYFPPCDVHRPIGGRGRSGCIYSVRNSA